MSEKKEWIFQFIAKEDFDRFKETYYTYYHQHVEIEDLPFLDLNDFLRFIPKNETIHRGKATILWKRFIRQQEK